MVEVVDVPASVTARAVATLTAPADGTIASLAVEPGATVAKGAVLAIIDSPAAQKRLADAKAALSAASGGAGAVRVADLTRLQDHLDASAADAFAAARSAAGEVADDKVRAALLAQVDVAQKQYESTAQTTRALATQVQQGVASLGAAVGALGAAQRAQAKAAYDVAASTVDALTLRAPIAGVVQFARPAAGTSADPLAGLLGAVSAGGGAAAGAAGAASPATNAGVAGVDDVLIGRRSGQRRHGRGDDRGRLRDRPGRRGGRDRRAAGRPGRDRRRSTWTPRPGSATRPPSGRSTCCRRRRRGAAWRTGSGSPSPRRRPAPPRYPRPGRA